MPRIRMCDEDRERYGGPEWVEVNVNDLGDERTGDLEAIEDHCDLMAGEFADKFARGSLKATRAMIWLGRRKAGCRDDFKTFRPRVLMARIEPLESERADADPPAPNRAQRRAEAGKRGKGKRTRKPADGSET